jgi:pimeloyl-ACP methyl ester carboxylesterase
MQFVARCDGLRETSIQTICIDNFRIKMEKWERISPDPPWRLLQMIQTIPHPLGNGFVHPFQTKRSGPSGSVVQRQKCHHSDPGRVNNIKIPVQALRTIFLACFFFLWNPALCVTAQSVNTVATDGGNARDSMGQTSGAVVARARKKKKSKPPTVTVSVSPTTVNQGGSATFLVSASSPPSQPITVTYLMGPGTALLGTDYILDGSPGQVTIPAGQPSASVALHALVHNLSGLNETATMTLGSGVGYKLPRKKQAGKSATVTISAPLEGSSQLISAAQGGTITLPGGSSLTIPPGVLANDQVVTLLLLSSMPDQPPSGIITSVGSALSASLQCKPGTTGDIQFALKNAAAAPAGVAGSAPMAELVKSNSALVTRPYRSFSRLNDLVDLSGGSVFVGVPGGYDPTSNTSTISVSPDLASNAGTINVSLGNLSTAAMSAPLPPSGGLMWDPTFSKWVAFSPQRFDPTKRTVVFVHGFFSTVQEAFGDCTKAIMDAGGYQQAVGFNYDTMNLGGVQQNGQDLAAFINSLGISRVDLVAHSKGGPVSLAAGCATTVKIGHMVLLGAPLEGSPIADSIQGSLTFLMNHPRDGLLVPRIQTTAIGLLLNTPWAQDFQTTGTTLPNLRACFDETHPETKLVLAAGTNPLGSSNLSEVALGAAVTLSGIFNEPFDMLVGQSSALAAHWPRASGATECGPYDLSHTQLECDTNVIACEAEHLDRPLPAIAVNPSSLTFSATEGGPAPSSQTFTIENVGPPGSILNYLAAKDAMAGWLGLSGPIIPLGTGESVTYTVSANPSGLVAAGSPYRATITVSDSISPNISQDIPVTFTISPTPTPAPSLPNLTPYKPAGWSDKIVVSNVTGTSTDSSNLTTADSLYLDWAVINNGAANITTDFTTQLYVDGVLKTFWTAPPPTNANFYRYVQDYNLGSLSAGTHTLRIKADSTDAVTESNESDNEYTKTITVQNPALSPWTITVMVVGNGTVTSSPAGISCPGTCTHTFAPNSFPFLIAQPGPGAIFDHWEGTNCFVESCPLVPSEFQNGLIVTAYFVNF